MSFINAGAGMIGEQPAPAEVNVFAVIRILFDD